MSVHIIFVAIAVFCGALWGGVFGLIDATAGWLAFFGATFVSWATLVGNYGAHRRERHA